MKIHFPIPESSNNNVSNPLNALESFCKEFNSKYEGHFFGVITTTSELIDDKTSIISYAFWVDFVKVKDYSYRFFEVKPTSIDGGYPVSVMAFHGPPEEFGIADSPDKLENTINDILNSERGRFIILSNY